MTLTIERTHPGREANDIKITRTNPDKPIEYFFLTQGALEELVRSISWYAAAGSEEVFCELKPGEVMHVG